MSRPLYDQLVSYYELLEGRDWEGEVRMISSVLERHGCRSVIDLGCGTGRHVRELAKLGFEATGVDISAHNIRFAKKEASKEGVDARFVKGSYFDVLPSAQYDAAVCLNWSIPVSDGQIRKLLVRVSSFLRPRGVMIFDYEKVADIVWDSVGRPSVEKWTVKGKVVARVSVGKIRSNVMISDDVYLTFPESPAEIPRDEASRYEPVKQGRGVKVYVDRSFVRFFTTPELKRFAQQCGFRTIANLVLPRNGYRRNYAVLMKEFPRARAVKGGLRAVAAF